MKSSCVSCLSHTEECDRCFILCRVDLTVGARGREALICLSRVVEQWNLSHVNEGSLQPSQVY